MSIEDIQVSLDLFAWLLKKRIDVYSEVLSIEASCSSSLKTLVTYRCSQSVLILFVKLKSLFQFLTNHDKISSNSFVWLHYNIVEKIRMHVCLRSQTKQELKPEHDKSLVE